MNDTLANTEKKTAYILTLPAVLLVFSIILFPIFANIWISFKEVELKDISFNSTSLKLIQIFAKIGNKIIEKTKRTAGKVSMYAVFFSVFARVSFIKKADNLYYPLFYKIKII